VTSDRTAPPARSLCAAARAPVAVLAADADRARAVAAWPLLRTIWWASPTPTCCASAGQVGRARQLTGKYGLFNDSVCARGDRHAVVHVSTVSIVTVVGMVIALVSPAPSRAAARARPVLIPWAIPTVVSPRCGADAERPVRHHQPPADEPGIIDAPRAWTADPDLLMRSVVLVDVWKTRRSWRCSAAALRCCPGVYEAAQIDGCTR